MSSKIFLSGEMFNFLLLYLNKYEDNEQIVLNTIKILRALLIKSKIHKIFLFLYILKK